VLIYVPLCQILQVIELPIKHPELFESLGIAQPKVILHEFIAEFAILCQLTWL